MSHTLEDSQFLLSKFVVAMVTLCKSSTCSLNFEFVPSASLHRVPNNLFINPIYINLPFLHDNNSNNVAQAEILMTVVRDHRCYWLGVQITALLHCYNFLNNTSMSLISHFVKQLTKGMNRNDY